MIITYAYASGYVIELLKTSFSPYLPNGPVSKALISEDASVDLRAAFKKRGIGLIFVEPLRTLPSSLSRHADMQLVHVSEGVFVYAPNISSNLLEELKFLGFELIRGAMTPGEKYPYDVAYNCAVVGKFAFLNARAADPVLIETLKKCGKIILSVKQGYAKCSVCIISSEAIITADASIHRKACEAGLDSLLIPVQKNIVLNGYDYGFIGGASGSISDKEIALLGSIEVLENKESIIDFLKKHGKSMVSMTHENPVDLGGVIPLCSV